MNNQKLQFGKKIQRLCCYLFVLTFTLSFTNVQAQVLSPCDANPFCSDSSYVFPNTSGNIFSAPTSPPVDYGICLSQPNPVWYWMQIGTAGTMQLTMTQTAVGGGLTDIDYAMWGPFTDLASGCAAILAGTPSIQSSYDGGGFPEVVGLGLIGGSGIGGGNGGAATSGTTTPPAAQVGQVYILILTNYANSAGTISFSQTAGTGAADCGIVCGLTADNSGNACMGNNVTVEAHNTDTTISWSYHWTGPNGFTSNAKNFTFTPTAAGVYNFEVTAISSEQDTCHAATSVTIFAKPNVALVDNSDKVICFPQTATLSVANPTAGDTYQWFDNGVAIAGETTSSITIDTTGVFKLIAQNANGCVDSTIPVHITWDKVDLDFSFQVSKGCTEDTVRFTNLSEQGKYWWNYGDLTSPDDTVKNPTHIYDVQNIYTVRLKVKDLGGCIDSVLKTVDVTHPLNAAFTQSVDTICLSEGAPVVFTDASVGDISNWNWNFGEGAPSTAQNPTYIFTQAGSHSIRLVVKEDNLPCYDTAYSTVQVDAVPFFNITQDKHVICAGEALNFDADYYANTIRNIAWNFGDGTQWNQFGASTHHYENPGVYWITADADFGACGISHATDSIVVNAYPVVNLGPDSVLCLDGPALTVSDLNNASDPSITWHWNTGAITPSIEIVHPGTYSLTATKDECATTETIEVNKDCYTDVPNVFTPNGDGVNDYFYPRQLLSKGVVGFSMTIFNRWGQKVFESNTANGRGWDGKFNSKDQPVGVYIYQINATLKNGRNESFTGNVTLVR
ncbi:PKD domain-containing protein [Taibaiella lutea]|uniref:PKD domain-containing protein n=1 Tax=Taibaiella lutea TaxID=2608001 RepID=A0A5M6CE43_9BACT|nr:PKD domain-containing protein [Taibaiella lutea]KAA5533317.1 PKD domain-containing protein [Taibaiella lutea]